MKVVLSEHNLEVDEGFEQVRNVSKIYMNKFKYWTFDNDIMLIKVSAGPTASPPTGSAPSKTTVCAAAEPAGAAQRQRPAGHAAGRRHAAADLRHLHGERLGRDADLQFLPVTCAASRGRADRPQLQAILLLGDDHPQHAVCRIELGRERLLPGTEASRGYLRCNTVLLHRGW